MLEASVGRQVPGALLVDPKCERSVAVNSFADCRPLSAVSSHSPRSARSMVSESLQVDAKQIEDTHMLSVNVSFHPDRHIRKD